MSDTQNPGISFVRTTMVPQAEPPTRESGAVKWVRENLLSSWLNGILTVIALYVVWYVVSHLYPWLAGSVWTAGSLTECRETLISYGREVGSSACGAVIADRWLQLLFGFYPADLYWRPIVAFALFFVAIAPVLFSETMPRQLIWFSIGYPFLAVWLIWGGAFWVPILVFLGFAAGGLGLFAGNKLAGPILGAIGAILFATIWWGFVTPFANEYLNEAVAKSRLESRVAEINATMTILSEEISAADAQAKELEDAIKTAVAEKDALFANAAQLHEVVDLAEAIPELEDRIVAETAKRDDLQQQVAQLEGQGAAQSEEKLTALQGELESVEARIVYLQETLDTSVQRQEELRTLVPQLPIAEIPAAEIAFSAKMDELMTLRRAFSALSVEVFQKQERQQNVRSLLSNINRLPLLIERLPQQISTAKELRAALPASVAELRSVDGAGDAVSSDDKSALRAAIAAEQAVQTSRDAITSTYSELGRVGLRPVQSRDIGGFMLGVIIGISGIVLSLPLGILLALGRQSPLFIINKVSVAFIEIIRGIPLIVWLITASLLLNYFLPPGTNFDLMLRVIIMVTLFASAYIAEVVRGGLAALPKGQYEAADALGLDYWKSMQLIVLPQALKISIPGIVNTFIGLFKDTTLVVFIGLLDPIGLSGSIRASTDWNGIYWELFVFIGLLFFVCCFSMGRYSLFLERKLQREHR